jgi:hypothetical protein
MGHHYGGVDSQPIIQTRVLIQIYDCVWALGVPRAFEGMLGDRKRGKTGLGGNSKLV